MSEIEKINILIVDDRPENLLVLEKLLESPDIKFIKAFSGDEALGLMLEYDFALVLLDVQMPGMDGFETAELMKGKEKTRYIPIIFVTAINKEKKYVFKGYEAGAVDYLFKPIEPYILKNKVNVFLELHKKALILKKQLKEIKVLRGLLPICSSCKKIRGDKGYWESIEVYIQEHSDAEFSHSFCPECAEKLYPEFPHK